MADVRLIDSNKAEKEFESCLNLLCKNPITSNTYEMSFSRQICNAALRTLRNTPTIDPETLRPVAHWEEIPGSYVSCAGENSWCEPATRCSNPECREVNPCGLKTPFCPMCGAKME